MPKRSLGVREIRFRTANVSEDKAESFAPCDIKGQSLLDIFEHWCEGLRGSTHVRKEAEECVLVKRVQRLDAETLLVDTLSGKMGGRKVRFWLKMMPNRNITFHTMRPQPAIPVAF